MIIAGVTTGVVLVVLIGLMVARKVDGDSTNFLVTGRSLARCWRRSRLSWSDRPLASGRPWASIRRWWLRQVRIMKNTLVFAPPKSKKERTTPAGDGVLDELDDFSGSPWASSVRRAGLKYVPQDDGMHALRGTCTPRRSLRSASRSRRSQGTCGTTIPGFTLRVYTHLMPSSGDKSRKAANALFKPKKRADGLTRSKRPETTGQEYIASQMAM